MNIIDRFYRKEEMIMNDFTKGELEDIKNGIKLLLQKDYCDNGYTIEIRSLEDKIQSMIDNYCEKHSFKLLSPDIGEECTKCGRIR